MASEAITQNDLREILSRTTGGVPSEYKKLLWANPSPNSAFAAQTITIPNLSNYDGIEIVAEYGLQEVNKILNTSAFPNGSLGSIITSQGSSGAICMRTATISGNQVTIGDGALIAGASASVSNNNCIPLNIYGIKYERVAPPQVDASDYVIEQGTDGVWTYRKWNSGIAECWGTIDQQVSGWTAWYSWYYSTPYTVRYNFPTGLFVGAPALECTKVYGVAGILMSELQTTNTQTPAFYLIRPDSGATGTYGLSFHATGRWK